MTRASLETMESFAPDVEHLQGNQRAQRRGKASHARSSELVVAARHTGVTGGFQFHSMTRAGAVLLASVVHTNHRPVRYDLSL